jgi:hypothetical protein
MRIVKWTDRNGWLHANYVRDNDPNTAAAQGVPVQMPELELLDCEEVKRDINNYLVEHDCYTWQDVQHKQNAITKAVRRALARRVVQMYKTEASQ